MIGFHIHLLVVAGVVSFLSMCMHQTEEKGDDSEDSFCQELEQVII